MSHSVFARVVAGAAVAMLCTAVASARDYDAGRLHIAHPWIRVAPPGAPTAAGYLTITNHGATPDRLLGGTAAGVGPIEVHEMSMTGQIMRMRPVTGGLLIAPGQTVALTPGGDRHLMLIGPKRPLKAGDQLPAILRFEKAGEVKVTFAVQDLGGRMTPPMQPMGMH
ncbi:MAG TPA: copper chaperone PCu(A)C [Caulobacteraceae bacterium]|nr:copper chaperone PCu(A)C [Caulobacteraceae bacterium]